jgi:hypothetical protein
VAGTPAGGSPSAVGAAGGGTPAGGADSFAAIEADFSKKKHTSKDELKQFFERYKLAGPQGASRAKEVAEVIIREEDPDFAPARALLGYKEFNHPIPEMISFTNYPYIRAVEEANKQRWFGPDEMKEYEPRCTRGRRPRAREEARPRHGDSTFRALTAPAAPSPATRTSRTTTTRRSSRAAPDLLLVRRAPLEEDLLAIPKKDRQAKLAELEATRKTYQRVLAEKAKIYQQLYAEFLKRYAEDCELKDLMGAYGGRPDYPMSKRSYKDGCPMIIWIFSDRKAFDDYHDNVVKSNIPTGVAGYFSPATGWVYLYDEPDNREFEINKNVHEGTHQLEHWFQKQKREWGPTSVPQSFFGEGFAEYIGSVNLAKDRSLKFHGINRPRLEFLKSADAQMKQQNRKLPIFPTKVLVGFEGYGAVDQWALENWKMPGLGFFYAQSWAFVNFLNEAEQKYQTKFKGYLDDISTTRASGRRGTPSSSSSSASPQVRRTTGRSCRPSSRSTTETLIPMDLSEGRRPAADA